MYVLFCVRWEFITIQPVRHEKRQKVEVASNVDDRKNVVDPALKKVLIRPRIRLRVSEG